MEDSQVAAAMSVLLAERVGRKRFDLWFPNQAQLCPRANCLTVRVSSPIVRDWLRKNFADDIRECWKTFADGAGTVEFELCSSDERVVAAGETVEVAPGNIERENRPIVAPPTSAPLTLSAHLRPAASPPTANVVEFGTFVVGQSNEYAFRAADLTARGRQQASPLVFCGPTGVGKTHLLRAIVREFRMHHPRVSSVYMSAEQFTTGFIEAVRGSGVPSFRQKCRGARLLAIDDLQFFAGKQRTLEELLHTFDTMAAEGRQLVIACDRGLSELRGFGQELISRLCGGLICEIELPEYVTRLGVLQRIRDELGLVVEDSVLAIVARQINDGPRALRGALLRLDAMSQAYGEPISRELTGRALADLARHSTRAVRLADVQKAVCDVFGVEPTQLRSDRKSRSLSEPRMLAMWLARKYTRVPWSEIGEFFGRRSHSTVISAHRRVEKMIASQAHVGVADRSCNVEDAIRRLEMAIKTA